MIDTREMLELANQIERELSFYICSAYHRNILVNAQAALRSAASAAPSIERETIERCAKIVYAECARILSKQKPNVYPMSIADSVNLNLRMMATILPEISRDLRALSPVPVSGEITEEKILENREANS